MAIGHAHINTILKGPFPHRQVSSVSCVEWVLWHCDGGLGEKVEDDY